MNTNSENNPLIKQPGAWIPLAMSFMAMTLILGHVAIFGITHETDEGTAAHLFQLLMVAQLPIGAYFAVQWLLRRPKQALLFLALQAAAWIVPVATILWLEGL